MNISLDILVLIFWLPGGRRVVPERKWQGLGFTCFAQFYDDFSFKSSFFCLCFYTLLLQAHTATDLFNRY